MWNQAKRLVARMSWKDCHYSRMIIWKQLKRDEFFMVSDNVLASKLTYPIPGILQHWPFAERLIPIPSVRNKQI